MRLISRNFRERAKPEVSRRFYDKNGYLGSNFIKKYGKLPVLLYKSEVLRAKNAAMF
jgi:hypothetical protein